MLRLPSCGHWRGGDAATGRRLDACYRQSPAGAEAVASAEVGQRWWNATEYPRQCVGEIGAGRREVLDQVVIVSPLTSEAILGLDFLQEQQATIYLASKKLRLRGSGCDLTLRDSTPLRVRSEQPVLAVRMVEVPPCSVLEIEASIETPSRGGVACAGSRGQAPPGGSGLRACPTESELRAGAAAEPSDGTSDSVRWNDASHT